jgi:hypothetical protein
VARCTNCGGEHSGPIDCYRGPHKCHAEACTKAVPPELLMCPRHWYKVPVHIRRMVRCFYRKGQEVDKQPRLDYLLWAKKAVDAVAIAEGRR